MAEPIAKANGQLAAAVAAPVKRHEEYQYLDLVREIMEDGEHRPDRYVWRSHIAQATLN